MAGYGAIADAPLSSNIWWMIISIAHLFRRYAVLMLIAAGTATAESKNKGINFYGERGDWRLIIGRDHSSYEVRLPGYKEFWTSYEFHQNNLKEGVTTSVTFSRISVVAREAVEESLLVTMTFTGERCLDQRGRIHPFSVVIRFPDNPEPRRGCGDRLS